MANAPPFSRRKRAKRDIDHRWLGVPTARTQSVGHSDISVLAAKFLPVSSAADKY